MSPNRGFGPSSVVEHSTREPTFPGSNPGRSTHHTAPFFDACSFRTLVKFLPPCYQCHLLQRWKLTTDAIYCLHHQKRNFLQSSSTHCSSLDIHWYCQHGTQNLAMWRRKFIKQQPPNISSTRDLVNKSLPCSSPPPPRTTRKNPSQQTAHIVMYMITSPLCYVYVREMLQ